MATDFVKGEVDASGRFQRQKTQFLTPLAVNKVNYLLKKIAIGLLFLMLVLGRTVN